MKQLALLLTLLASPAIAGFSQAQIDDCRGNGDLAASIMRARQAGLSMSDMLIMLNDPQFTDVLGFRERTLVMIQMAFDVRRAHTPEVQARFIEDFREEFELLCFSTLTQEEP